MINVAFVGHVDHGKSSILGRLLVETGALPDGKLEQLKTYCQNHAKDFEYAFLTDALEKEQSQGITIDAARYFVRASGRKFLFIDTPGHRDFLQNMITGSASADIALLIIDAKEGVRENTHRHIFLLSFLGIEKVVVVVNKMDQVGYSEEVFNEIASEVKKYLKPVAVLPVSAKFGDHFMGPSVKMSWYRGQALWESLCAVNVEQAREGDEFRMPLQDVYRFSQGDERRIYCGTVISGSLREGDRVFFSPSGKEGVVAKIESEKAQRGYAIGFTLREPLFVERGEIVSGTKLEKAIRLRARLFWMGRSRLVVGKKYVIRIYTAKVACQISEIYQVVDSATLGEKREADCHDIIDCVIVLSKPVAAAVDRFVLIDGMEIVAAGAAMEEKKVEQRVFAQGVTKVQMRRKRWFLPF